jgi:hypothetical protein
VAGYLPSNSHTVLGLGKDTKYSFACSSSRSLNLYQPKSSLVVVTILLVPDLDY